MILSCHYTSHSRSSRKAGRNPERGVSVHGKLTIKMTCRSPLSWSCSNCWSKNASIQDFGHLTFQSLVEKGIIKTFQLCFQSVYHYIGQQATHCMLKGDAIFQSSFNARNVFLHDNIHILLRIGAVAIVQLIKFCYFFFSSYNHVLPFLLFLVFDILCKNTKK